MQDALIERQCVDERLEGGARGAFGGGAVHLASDVLVEEIGGANQRLHFHGARVHQHRGGVVHAQPGLPGDVASDVALQQGLQPAVERGADFRRAAGIRQHGVDQVRRSEGQLSR